MYLDVLVTASKEAKSAKQAVTKSKAVTKEKLYCLLYFPNGEQKRITGEEK